MRKICFKSTESRGVGDLPNKQIPVTGPAARRGNYGSLLADFFLARPYNTKIYPAHPNHPSKQKRKTSKTPDKNTHKNKIKITSPETIKTTTTQTIKTHHFKQKNPKPP